jgi:hypothetical protein
VVKKYSTLLATLPSTPSTLSPQPTSPITMEPIEEQWNPPSSPDIMSDSWINISDAKKAIKIWILDRGESWASSTQTTRLDFNFIASFLLVPSIFELLKRRTVSIG